MQKLWTAFFALIVAAQITLMVLHTDLFLYVPVCTWTPSGWAGLLLRLSWIALALASPAIGIVAVTDKTWRFRYFAVTAILVAEFLLVLQLNRAGILMCDGT